MTRIRRNDSKVISGTITNNGEVVATGSYSAEYWYMEDEIGKKPRKTPPTLKGYMPATPHVIRKVRGVPVMITSKDPSELLAASQWPSQGGYPDWSNVPYYEWYRYQRLGYDKGPLLQQLLAATNPGRPQFSVPVFIRELMDIPSLFQLAAKSFYQFVGGAYLNYRFGWVQFVRDVRTLVKVTVAIERRIREFQSLVKMGGLRRRVVLESTSYDVNRVDMINGSWSHVIYADFIQHATIRKVGHVRWVCSRDFAADLEQLGAFNRAAREVFDLEMIDAETLWQMLPWSWLADYFLNIGSFLGAKESSQDFKPYDACITWEADLKLRVLPRQDLRHSCSPGWFVEHKTSRSQALTLSDFPSARLDFISQSQVEVLLALFLRFKG